MEQFSNISTEIIRRKEAFKDNMRSLQSCMRACKDDNSVCVFDVRIMVIVNDMLNSSFLAIISIATSARYTRADKMMVKHKSMLLLLTDLGGDVPVANNIGITDLNDAAVYILCE